MKMTPEQFIGVLEEKIMPVMEEKLLETVASMKEEADEARKKELVEEKTELDTKIAECDEALVELQKAVDRKNMPAEEKEQDLSYKGGFSNLGHLCHDIYKAGANGRDESGTLSAWRTYCADKAAGSPSQSAGEAEAGGYLIPTEFASDVLVRASQQSDILQRAMIVPMETNKIDVPFLDGFDESQGKVAGNVIYYWKGEEKQYAASDVKVGQVSLNLNKCTGLAFMTDDIMKFSPTSAQPLLERAFETGLNRAITKACIRGTGVGMPLGVLGSDCTIEVAKETGQAADTFVLENSVKMLAQLYSEDESIGDAVWFLNKTLLPQVAVMSLSVGTGGSAVFIGNAQDSLNLRLLGLPIRFSPQMSAAGDSGDAGLFDWRQYLIGQPTGQVGAEMAQSIHLKFDYGQTAFRFTFYMDGRPWWKESFKPLYGDEQSPFLKLEAR